MNNLKYLKITFILIFLCGQIGLAQIKIGAKIGYSIGNINDTSNNIYAQDYSSTSGIDIGVLGEFPVINDFSIQAEISYTQRGGERIGIQPIPFKHLQNGLSDSGFSLALLNQLLEASGGSAIDLENPLYADFVNIAELQYIEIPILAKYGWGSDWRFYVNAGPYLGLLINSNQKTSGESGFYLDAEGNMPITTIQNPFYNPNNPLSGPEFIELGTQSFDAETDTQKDLNTGNFGIQGGAGIIKKLAEKHELFFDFRASYGFIPLQKEAVYGESKVGGFVFSLGYAFTL